MTKPEASDALRVVTLSREDLVFLRDLRDDMLCQDNRATASPYYYAIRYPVWVRSAHGYEDEMHYYSADENHVAPAQWWEEARGIDVKTAMRSGYLEEAPMRKVHKTMNAFLTEFACDDHMKANAHNMPAGAHNYIEHAYRNPQLIKVFAILDKLGRQAEKELN